MSYANFKILKRELNISENQTFFHDLSKIDETHLDRITIDNFIELHIFDTTNLTAYYKRVPKDYYNLEDAKEYLKCLFLARNVFMKNVKISDNIMTIMYNSLVANSRSDAQKSLFKVFYERKNYAEIARNYAYNKIYVLPKRTKTCLTEQLNKIANVDVIKVENAPDLLVTTVPSKPNEYQKKRYTFKVLNQNGDTSTSQNGDTSQNGNGELRNGFNSLSEMTYMIKD